MERLNLDSLEHVFSFLDFRSLVACEMTCRAWQQLIQERRLFWQMTKRLCRRPAPSPFKAEAAAASTSAPAGRKRRRRDDPGGGRASALSRLLLRTVPLKKWGGRKLKRVD